MGDTLTFNKVKGDDKRRLDSRYGRTVQINRHKYKVKWCGDLKINGECINGLCDLEARVLYVDVGAQDFDATLLHEIFHAEFVEGGFRQRTNWDNDLEEHIVEALSQSVAHNFEIKPRGAKWQRKKSPG
jgi:hypothetical protein